MRLIRNRNRQTHGCALPKAVTLSTAFFFFRRFVWRKLTREAEEDPLVCRKKENLNSLCFEKKKNTIIQGAFDSKLKQAATWLHAAKSSIAPVGRFVYLDGSFVKNRPAKAEEVLLVCNTMHPCTLFLLLSFH